MKFEEFKLSDQLKIAIKKLNFDSPTEIQEGSIPAILDGKDLIGESATGSGKTLAFGCALIEHIKLEDGLKGLVLTPTRELAEQVKDTLKKMSYNKRLNIISVYGGVSIEPQIEKLKKANIVVATPGRFMDHMNRRTVNTSQIDIFVLDEAVRMFDMGFIDDVKLIRKACPNIKQNLFFSATISGRVKDLARKYTRDPIEVAARNQVDASKLKQIYYDVQRNLKISLLLKLLEEEKSGLVMVFCNTRRTVDSLVKNLTHYKFDATGIHGGFSQNKRTKTLENFNTGRVGVMVCTDVAARGLHIDDVSHVYNFDLPNDPKDYVHRIGRTARAGKDGKVINIICQFDYDNFSNILNNYRDFKVEKVDPGYIEKVDIVGVGSRSGFSRDGGSGRSYGRNSSRNDSRSRGRSNYKGGQGRSSRSNDGPRSRYSRDGPRNDSRNRDGPRSSNFNRDGPRRDNRSRDDGDRSFKKDNNRDNRGSRGPKRFNRGPKKRYNNRRNASEGRGRVFRKS